MKGIIFLLLIFICPTAPCIGQQSDYIYTNYTVRDGLPSNECYDIVQDHLGYIWLSTDNGVARFDGQKFKPYGPKDGLNDNIIFRLEIDEIGRIWAGGIKDEFFVYSHNKDRFEPWEYNHILAKYRSKDEEFINDFAIQNGLLSTMRNEFGVININEDGAVTIDSLSKSAGFQLIIKNKKSFMMERSLSNQLLTSTKLHYHDTTYNIEIPVPAIVVKNQYRTFYHEKSCIVSIYGQTSGLERNEVKWKRKEKSVNKFKTSRDGSLVACFGNNGGVRKYSNVSENQYISLIEDIAASNFLEDTKGGYWITSIDKGLFYIKNINFSYLSNHHTEQYFTDVISDGKDRIFTGSFNGDLGVYNLTAEKYNLLYESGGKEYNSLNYNMVDGNLYASISPHIFLIDSIYNLFDISYTLSKPADHNVGSILDMFFVGNVGYCVAAGSDFYKMKNENGIISYEEYDLDINDNFKRGNKILKSKADIIYVGDINGLQVKSDDARLDFQADSLFIGLRIEDIIEDDSGKLLLATKGKGLAVFDPESRKVTYIDETQGLIDNNLEDIEVQDNNTYWAASLKGISRVDISDLENPSIKNYTISHGLPVPDVYSLAWDDGYLYAATGKGVVKIRDVDLESVSKEPRVVFMRVNNESRQISESYNLDYDENAVNIHYETLNHAHAPSQRYRYRFNDEEWTTTNQSDLILTNLSPGKYDVNIQSENEDGVWSRSKTISIKVNLPWYNTWWFYLLILLGIFSTVYYYFKSRELALRKEAAIKDELRSLEKAALQSQMNPHFIFNSLNSIQNFIMTNDKFEAMNYLSRFAKLIRLILNASADDIITLYNEIQLLKHYLSLEKLRFKSKFNFMVNIEKGIDMHNLHLSPMLIQPLVENAVKHGMDGIEEGGIIEVNITKTDGRLHVMVRDNGKVSGNIGNTNIAAFNNNAKNHRSLGMRITRKRLNMQEEIKVNRVEGWTEVGIWL